MIYDVSSWVANGVFRALVRGNTRVRLLFLLAAISLIVAIIAATIAVNFPSEMRWLNVVAGIFGVLGGTIIIVISGYEQALVASERETKIKKAEDRAREHPNEPRAAWELARVKLESYLNRNLTQIAWIFILTLLVMIVGFVIIGYGVVRVYQSPDNFRPSIVVTVSGVIVEFIAATFLLIYRSTMEQAKEYVNILERINAVGMSVRILDSIESNDGNLRDKTRSEIALNLLTIYGNAKQ